MADTDIMINQDHRVMTRYRVIGLNGNVNSAMNENVTVRGNRTHSNSIERSSATIMIPQ